LPSVVFATYANTEEERRHVIYLAESIRAFAGKLSKAPLWVYSDNNEISQNRPFPIDPDRLGIEIKSSQTPDDARWFYYAGKTFAAGRAEVDAEGSFDILVWMDEDTIVLKEPGEFILETDIEFAYCPVMHNRTGSLFSEPPDPFWSRIYERLAVNPKTLFPMTTPADRQKIRAYFNAGLLVVRPERKILRRWGKSFQILYRDTELAGMCRKNIEYRIFLHQTALVGAVLNNLDKDSMTRLSTGYNYPLFFKKMYGAEQEFDNLDDIATLRYDIYFRNPDSDWSHQLKGPEHVISWLKDRLGRN
jgi:hypothetical protein